MKRTELIGIMMRNMKGCICFHFRVDINPFFFNPSYTSSPLLSFFFVLYLFHDSSIFIGLAVVNMCDENEEDYKFAACTYFAKNHPGETCGSNGLPLTPSSITILGRAQQLLTLDHSNLCTYLDVIRGKHGNKFRLFKTCCLPLINLYSC